MILLTDRSRLGTYGVCPRKLFWTYYWGGKGVVQADEPLPFLFGNAIHTGLESLLIGHQTLEQAREAGIRTFSGLPPFLAAEQAWLFSCLIELWATHRLPDLRAEFDFIKVEPEILWELGSENGTTVIQMIRPDLLARRTADGGLFYVEWKTTGYGEDGWSKKWEKNAQVLCNALALEETLKEPIEGVMIEGLVKGRRQLEWRKSSRFQGQMLQQSPLCYTWELTDGSLSRTWRAGATHMPVWEIPGITPEGWTGGFEPVKFLRPVLPIIPDRDDMASWRESAKWKMLSIQEGLERVASAKPEEKRKVAARYFPQNFEACYPFGFGSRCPCFDLCFTPGVRQDPLSQGYVLRTPHHEAEQCPDSED